MNNDIIVQNILWAAKSFSKIALNDFRITMLLSNKAAHRLLNIKNTYTGKGDTFGYLLGSCLYLSDIKQNQIKLSNTNDKNVLYHDIIWSPLINIENPIEDFEKYLVMKAFW